MLNLEGNLKMSRTMGNISDVWSPSLHCCRIADIYQMMLEILISILGESSLLQAQSIEEQSAMFVCDDI